MTQFQTNLDLATLEFNKSLTVELQAYFNATQYSIVFLDLFTKGLLSQVSNQYISDDLNHGTIITNNSNSFLTLLRAPSSLYKNPPTENFVQESANFICKRFNTNIGVCLAGIKGFKDSLNNTPIKIFIGFNFNDHLNTRVIQCNSNEKNNFEQIIHAIFGYLKMMFQKHTKKN